MLKSIRGTYQDGRIELYGRISDIESAEVIVTFIPPEAKGVDPRARGLTVEQVIELRQRLLTFEEDWNAPGMEAYDEL